jgi:hypothetical protein
MIWTVSAGGSLGLAASFAASSTIDIERFIGDFEYSAQTMNLHRSERMVSSRIKGSPTVQCVFITAGPITKLFAGGEEESGGHVL